MKKTITNLKDFKEFINSLNETQLAQPAKFIPLGHESREIVEVEIAEEPFLEAKNNKDDFGYPSELRRVHGDDFHESDYKEIEPVGMVIIYTK